MVTYKQIRCCKHEWKHLEQINGTMENADRNLWTLIVQIEQLILNDKSITAKCTSSKVAHVLSLFLHRLLLCVHRRLFRSSYSVISKVIFPSLLSALLRPIVVCLILHALFFGVPKVSPKCSISVPIYLGFVIQVSEPELSWWPKESDKILKALTL